MCNCHISNKAWTHTMFICTWLIILLLIGWLLICLLSLEMRFSLAWWSSSPTSCSYQLDSTPIRRTPSTVDTLLWLVNATHSILCCELILNLYVLLSSVPDWLLLLNDLQMERLTHLLIWCDVLCYVGGGRLRVGDWPGDADLQQLLWGAYRLRAGGRLPAGGRVLLCLRTERQGRCSICVFVVT